MSKGLFIIGTDTGVGKTFMAALLASYWKKQKHYNVGVMKPFESGSPAPGYTTDREQLWEAAGKTGALAPEICPYPFSEPLAPMQAAEKIGQKINPKTVLNAFQTIENGHDCIIVEGCGGLMVPLSPQDYDFTVEFLVKNFALPILLVARLGLGTLNHTLLTLSRCETIGLPVLGVIMNESDFPIAEDPSRELNFRTLQKLTQVPIWGPFQHFAKEISASEIMKVPKYQAIFSQITEAVFAP